jgi:thiol-disulfide isomerase/thioredoxin
MYLGVMVLVSITAIYYAYLLGCQTKSPTPKCACDQLSPQQQQEYSNSNSNSNSNSSDPASLLPSPSLSPPEESSVTFLTGTEFVGVLDTDTSPTCVLMFYASWCSHSKQMLPIYQQAAAATAAATAAAAAPSVRFYVLDETTNKASIDKYSVQGFPTIMKIVKGKPFAYTGPRIATDVQVFACNS